MMELVGFKRFTSKAGKKFCVANVVGDYTSRDIEHGKVGRKVEEIFLPDSQYDYLTPNMLGNEVHTEYEFSGNRAYLVSFTVDTIKK